MNKSNEFKIDKFELKGINNIYELKVFYTNGKFATLNFKYLDECLDTIRNSLKKD